MTKGGPETDHQSPIDIYLSSPEMREVLKRGKVVKLIKDEEERYLRVDLGPQKGSFITSKDQYTFEVFLNAQGESVGSRIIITDPPYKHPRVIIRGQEGDLEYCVLRKADLHFRDGKIIGESPVTFFMFGIKRDDRKIVFFTDYRTSMPGAVTISWVPQTTPIDSTKDTIHQVRFIGLLGSFWREDDSDKQWYQNLDKEIVDSKVNCSFHLEIEKILQQQFFKMAMTDLSNGRRIVLNIPGWFNQEELDKRLLVSDKSWKDLGRQIPVTLSISNPK